MSQIHNDKDKENLKYYKIFTIFQNQWGGVSTMCQFLEFVKFLHSPKYNLKHFKITVLLY